MSDAAWLERSGLGREDAFAQTGIGLMLWSSEPPVHSASGNLRAFSSALNSQMEHADRLARPKISWASNSV